jgi:hypothetical protein
MRLWGMRLLVHRGQVLLLLVVGVLTGVAIAGVCLQMDGASILAALRVNQVFEPPRSQVPAEIVIGAIAPRTGSGLGDRAAAKAVPPLTPVAPVAPTQPAAPPAYAGQVRPSPTTAMVPAIVYTYPPDDHGGGSGGGGSGGGGSNGGGSSASPSPGGHH